MQSEYDTSDPGNPELPLYLVPGLVFGVKAIMGLASRPARISSPSQCYFPGAVGVQGHAKCRGELESKRQAVKQGTTRVNLRTREW
jgi:hypothetical protein